MASEGDATVVDGLPVEEKQTHVVHMVAGPGAGKTTAAYEVCCALKKLGYSVEYAPERAKELVADGQGALLAEGSLAVQRELCAEQQHRIDRWVGKVDFVVTDSAPILGLQYLKEEGPEAEAFAREVKAAFDATDNFVLFVERGGYYEQVGRVQTREEALAVDEAVKRFLERNGVYYGTYGHDRIETAVRNMQTTLSRISGMAPDDLRARGAVQEECARAIARKFAVLERTADPSMRGRLAMNGKAETARMEAAFASGAPASEVRRSVYARLGEPMPRTVPESASRRGPAAPSPASKDGVVDGGARKGPQAGGAESALSRGEAKAGKAEGAEGRNAGRARSGEGSRAGARPPSPEGAARPAAKARSAPRPERQPSAGSPAEERAALKEGPRTMGSRAQRRGKAR